MVFVIPLNTGDLCYAETGCAGQGYGRPLLSSLCSKRARGTEGEGRTATQPKFDANTKTRKHSTCKILRQVKLNC